jgi:hypothetical protein
MGRVEAAELDRPGALCVADPPLFVAAVGEGEEAEADRPGAFGIRAPLADVPGLLLRMLSKAAPCRPTPLASPAWYAFLIAAT